MDPRTLTEEGISVSLSNTPLDVSTIIATVKNLKAGAVVVFAGNFPNLQARWMLATTATGVTRDNVNGKLVKSLEYSSYEPRALTTMKTIAVKMKEKHALTAISLVHRLGVVPIGDESILIAVSAPHRQAAWRAGEEALNDCKAKVEIWKYEVLEGDDEGTWKANRDEAGGTPC